MLLYTVRSGALVRIFCAWVDIAVTLGTEYYSYSLIPVFFSWEHSDVCEWAEFPSSHSQFLVI